MEKKKKKNGQGELFWVLGSVGVKKILWIKMICVGKVYIAIKKERMREMVGSVIVLYLSRCETK